MNATTLGEIRSDSIYPLEVVKRLTGLGEGALRAMRRNGLSVRYVGGKGFISGKALVEYIDQQGKETK